MKEKKLFLHIVYFHEKEKKGKSYFELKTYTLFIIG